MPRDRDEYNAYMRTYILERFHRRRAAVIEQLGGACARCGSTEGLEFDHVDPTTKVDTIGKMWSYSGARFQEELAKCQLLCGPCHRDKTRLARQWRHGTEYAWAKHQCKCFECAAAHDVHLERRRQRRRRGGVANAGLATGL